MCLLAPEWQPFSIFCQIANKHIMPSTMNQTTILFRAPGQRSSSPVVILTGLSLSAKYSTSLRARFSRALSMAWQSAKCKCTPARIITAACAVCAVTAFFAGLATAVSHSDSARILLAVSTTLGLPLAIAGSFITSTAKKGGHNARI